MWRRGIRTSPCTGQPGTPHLRVGCELNNLFCGPTFENIAVHKDTPGFPYRAHKETPINVESSTNAHALLGDVTLYPPYRPFRTYDSYHPYHIAGCSQPG